MRTHVADSFTTDYPRVWICTRCNRILRCVVGDERIKPARTYEICERDSNELQKRAGYLYRHAVIYRRMPSIRVSDVRVSDAPISRITGSGE